MKMLPVMAALALVSVSSQAIAQSETDREACEGDVYEICADKIPDQDEIVVCLRKNWSKVSKECRRVMASYGKKKRQKDETGGAKTRQDLGY